MEELFNIPHVSSFIYVKMQNKKNIIYRFYIGVKKGLFTPTLPNHIILLNKNPFIRIFRVLGGISILLILTHRLDYLGAGLLYFYGLSVCTLLAFLFSLYLIFLTYHRIKHMIKVLNSDDLDVRNSPLDRFASIVARIILCSKGFCETAAPVGVVFGGMAGIDELRKAKGLEPIFLPKLAGWILPETDTNKQIKQMRYEEASLERNSKELDAYKEENSIVDSFEKNGVISKDEGNIWRDQIKRNESLCQNNSKDIKSKILESLDKLNEIRNNRK